jgi:hypothetical protein
MLNGMTIYWGALRGSKKSGAVTQSGNRKSDFLIWVKTPINPKIAINGK